MECWSRESGDRRQELQELQEFRSIHGYLRGRVPFKRRRHKGGCASRLDIVGTDGRWPESNIAIHSATPELLQLLTPDS